MVDCIIPTQVQVSSSSWYLFQIHSDFPPFTDYTKCYQHESHEWTQEVQWFFSAELERTSKLVDDWHNNGIQGKCKNVWCTNVTCILIGWASELGTRELLMNSWTLWKLIRNREKNSFLHRKTKRPLCTWFLNLEKIRFQKKERPQKNEARFTGQNFNPSINSVPNSFIEVEDLNSIWRCNYQRNQDP